MSLLLAVLNCVEYTGVLATIFQNSLLNASKSRNSRPLNTAAIADGIAAPAFRVSSESQTPSIIDPSPVTDPAHSVDF